LTKRDYSYQLDDLCDMAISICVGIWTYTYYTWNQELQDPDDGKFARTKPEIYTINALRYDIVGDFNMLQFLAAIIFFMWSRFILQMQLTRTFGPMLRIIIVMVGDVFKFLTIWSVLLALLASVSSLLFGSLPKYSEFKNVLFMMFGTGLGTYDLADFTKLDTGPPESGEILTILAVIINNVVLLNFIVAILADTYSKLSTSSLGLYYDGIISRIPVYEDDSRYGALIVGTPPTNAMAIVVLPIFSCIRDEKTLRSINDVFTKLMYAPIALIVTLTFMALNFALLPFAYLSSIY